MTPMRPASCIRRIQGSKESLSNLRCCSACAPNKIHAPMKAASIRQTRRANLRALRSPGDPYESRSSSPNRPFARRRAICVRRQPYLRKDFLLEEQAAAIANADGCLIWVNHQNRWGRFNEPQRGRSSRKSLREAGAIWAGKFRRRIKIAPGFSLNLGKRGASLSMGGRGFTTNLSSKGVHRQHPRHRAELWRASSGRRRATKPPPATPVTRSIGLIGILLLLLRLVRFQNRME